MDPAEHRPQIRNKRNESTEQKRYDASKHALDEIALNLSRGKKLS